ncbi:YggT family protein [Chthonobacter rhizosphaerae]|uniref:YggT family protein n=1 Tax=Chthonobacter rhizosphaerae TaxID=2735553 RepID=UPI0015EF48E3|nr:YggT family protein [Chthonobacter rhizosphaerae]
MAETNPFWDHWYFHVPNYVLALAMYLMMGRLLLTPFVPPGSGNYIWRSFVRLTDPVLRVVAMVTPAAAPAVALLVFGFLWIFLARIALYVGLAAAGLAPSAT